MTFYLFLAYSHYLLLSITFCRLLFLHVQQLLKLEMFASNKIQKKKCVLHRIEKKLLRTVLKTKTNKQNCNPSLVLLMCQNWCKQSPFRMFKVIRDCQESIDWEGCESSLPQFIANSRALATKVCRNEKGIHLFI